MDGQNINWTDNRTLRGRYRRRLDCFIHTTSFGGILFAVPDACKWTRGGWEILMKAGRWLPGQLWRCQVSDLVWGAASHWSAGSLMRPLIGQSSRILLQPVQDPDKSWVMITSQPETGTEENKTKYILEAIEKTTRVNMKVLQSRNKWHTLEKRMHST